MTYIIEIIMRMMSTISTVQFIIARVLHLYLCI